MLPSTRTSPTTCSLVAGDAVPMPRLPLLPSNTKEARRAPVLSYFATNPDDGDGGGGGTLMVNVCAALVPPDVATVTFRAPVAAVPPIANEAVSDVALATLVP